MRHTTTNIAQNSGVTLEGMGDESAYNFSQVTPQVAAETIVAGMKADKFQVYVGRDARMMNLLYRLNPRWAARFIFKQMGYLLPD